MILFIWGYRRRIRLLHKFAQGEVLGELILSFSSRKYKMKIVLLLAAAGLIIISLMRPEWGFRWHEVKRKGVDIFIALDTSRSMLAQDIKLNRLGRAKLAIKDLVTKLKGDRIGLIAFAGTAFIQCPLTMDYGGFLITLNDVNANTIPRGGTDIAAAINKAIKSYPAQDRGHRVLIVFTDGENHEGDPVKSAQAARAKGIKIFCIGVGTRAGSLIPIKDKQGSFFLKDSNGNIVKTHLNEAILQKIALETGGAYVHAVPLHFGLALIYKRNIAHMAKLRLRSKMVKQYEERFQLPLFLAFIILVWDTLLITYKREDV